MSLSFKRLPVLLAVLQFSLTSTVRGEEWPQWLGPQRDGVWRETGIVKEFPAGGPPVRWRTKIGGGYSGPAVVGKHVFVTDKQMPAGITNPSDPFDRTKRQATERVLCLSDDNGAILWKHEYDCPYTVSYPAGPRTTPVVQDGRVYTLGSEGHLFCLNEDDGTVIWSKNFRTDYGREQPPVWGYSANPLLDGDRLICLVGGKGQTVVAFHKETGKELWRALDSETEHGPGYGSPIIVEAGGRRQLIVWHPAALSSLDPETGKTFWEEPFTSKAGMSVATPRLSRDKLLISAFYDGALLVKLDPTEPKATKVWRRQGQNERLTEALHCVISTPVIEGDFIYGVCSYGELRGLELASGNRLWSTFEATSKVSARWGSAFLVKQDDRYFLFSEQGDLIIARLSPAGYEEISRAHLLEPTGPAQRREVVWSHPAFAHRNVYARNDLEIISVSLAADPSK
ncbi:PQQ-binding-like beta-propeller repeat protein [Schlesneria paludicola]|uniref:PQQ-binding-like beta-propeller repeat protein n=1 Tax=Schlesneria paludicola TaxID=360056 RepID=UPI00029A7674|nr:PQQ-binding-like beta-propeller repeat protein [Schlesneria paludicola]